MANTFLKRKLTLQRLWEVYSSKIPLWGHLFLALTSFALLLAPVTNWQQPYYDSIHLAGPLALTLMSTMLSMPSFIWSIVTVAGIVLLSILLLRLKVEPAVAAFWAFVVLCTTIILPMSKCMWLESVVMTLWAGLVLVSVDLRTSLSLKLNILFAILLLISVLLYLPSILLVPIFTNYALARKIPEIKNRFIYSFIIILTSVVALVGIAMIFNVHFWDSLSMINIFNLPLALWTVLFSPGRSLFLYSPVLIVAVIGYLDMIDSDLEFARLYTGIVVVATTGILLLEGVFTRQTYSGEPFIVLLPFLFIPLAWIKLERKVLKFFFVFSVISGFIFQLVLHEPISLNQWNNKEIEKVYLPSDSPVFRWLTGNFVHSKFTCQKKNS